MEPSDAPLSSTPPPDSSREARGSLGRHFQPSDLRGASQLATEATLEGTRLVEAVHAAVLGMLRPGSRCRSRTTGLTGWIYRTIRRIARFSGQAATRLFGASERIVGSAPAPNTRERRQLLAVLNGILGDHLARSGSPLARPFSLHALDGSPVDLERIAAAAPDTVVVFVHGLCMGEDAWTQQEPGRPGLVETVASAVGGMPVLVRYNTGLSIRLNGERLSEHLSRLTAARARGRQKGSLRLVLVTHSMGGLVARSAAGHARRTSARGHGRITWPDRVTETVFIGTPHRGAPLERAGAWVEDRLRQRSLTAPFASAAGLRSRGIQDLRHGDAGPTDPSTDEAGRGVSGGRALCVAGTLSAEGQARETIGDGLVPVSSALGHANSTAEVTRRIFEGTGHIELLRSPAVIECLRSWVSSSGCR